MSQRNEPDKSRGLSPAILFGAMVVGACVGLLFMGPLGLVIGPLLGICYWHFAPNRPPFKGVYPQTPPWFNRTERVIHSNAEEVFKQRHGSTALTKWKIDQKSEASWYTDKVWIDLLSTPSARLNDNVKFPIYVEAAKVASRAGDHSKAIGYLNRALSIKPDNTIACFRLAEAFERESKGENAVNAYRSALDHSKKPEVQEFISSQIARVKKQGPIRKEPMPGLKHLGLGR